MVTALVGVRYSPPGRGVTAALALTPVIAALDSAQALGAHGDTRFGFMAWGGGSIGYQF